MAGKSDFAKTNWIEFYSQSTERQVMVADLTNKQAWKKCRIEAEFDREISKFWTPAATLLWCIVLAALLIWLCPKAHASTASWYGVTGDTCDPWKHTVTANGEKFNERALTAASWKYRLGSRIKVTNLRNHKSVVVRINDRGPGKHLYRKGRIVDLSRGAFMKIAKLDDGVVPVKVALLKRRAKHAVR